MYCLSSGESRIPAASVFTLLFMKSAPWVINHLSLNVLIVQRASWLSEMWAPCVRVCCPTCESSPLPSFLPASTLNSRLRSPCSSSSSQQVGLNTSFSQQQQLGEQFLLFSPLDLSTLIKPLSMCWKNQHDRNFNSWLIFTAVKQEFCFVNVQNLLKSNMMQKQD